jgi:LacI family transcriptional regulator
MATMKDVAKAAGVSLGSVSHYLNGRVPVSPAKALKIQRAIDDLGYRVDQGARSLRRRRTQTIGLILPDISNPFYAELARVIEHRLWDEGFQTFFCDSAHDAARERAQFLNLLDRRVDGILVIYSSEESVLARLAGETATAVIFLDRPVRGQLSVASDNLLGGRMAAEHLLELGHARIGALVGDAKIANIQERMTGFGAALAERGVALEPDYILYGAQNLALGDRVVELTQLASPPTAIFATNDIVAIGAWRKLVEQGCRIPEDISLLGFDNVEMGRLLLPPLTTIAQDISALGAHATELLLNHFRNPLTEGCGVVVAPQLLVRGSTTHKRRKGESM